MRRHPDLMERLAAADPVRDGEPSTPEEQREADALLARLLATPVEPAAAPWRPRSRLRRRALAVAAAGCAALAVAVAIDLVGSDTPATSVVDRAVAAVTRGGVYHVVGYTTLSGSPEARQELLMESWHTSDGRLHTKGFKARDGRQGSLVEDFAGRRRPGRTHGAALLWDASSNTISEGGFAQGGGLPYLDPFQAPGSQLQKLQEEGRLRLAGTTTVDGKRAYRLVSDRIKVDDQVLQIEITVDAETYLPLTQRLSFETGAGPELEALTRYRVYERLALNDKTERRLALDPHPGAKCSELAHELTEAKDLGFPNPCAER